MKETLRKLGLLLSSLAVILFMTGCPSPETPVEPTKYTVTVYAAEHMNIFLLSYKFYSFLLR